MVRVSWRFVLVGVLAGALAAAHAATALAQRGSRPGVSARGSGPPTADPRPTGSFSGYMTKAPYDGRFTFVRMSYDVGLSGFGRRGRGPTWAHDYPTGEANFLQILSTVSSMSVNVEASSVVAFDDPDMFRSPVIYLVEPGYWLPSDEQVSNLRDYLAKGGFLIVDDFPDWSWSNFDQQMRRVFPEGRWFELNGEPDHPIFHTFYEVDANAIVTLYNLGGQPLFRALYEDNDPERRMQVIVNYQNDLSEYWEYSSYGTVPVDESNEAYKFGVNEFIYGLTH